MLLQGGVIEQLWKANVNVAVNGRITVRGNAHVRGPKKYYNGGVLVFSPGEHLWPNSSLLTLSASVWQLLSKDGHMLCCCAYTRRTHSEHIYYSYDNLLLCILQLTAGTNKTIPPCPYRVVVVAQAPRSTVMAVVSGEGHSHQQDALPPLQQSHDEVGPQF